MPESIQHLIFSDVDGTLLDPAGNVPAEWPAVQAALSGSLVVLSSSRTVAELLILRETLGIDGPLIAENGAVIALPGAWRTLSTAAVEQIGGQPVGIVPLGTPRAQLAALVRHAAGRVGMPVETTGIPAYEIDPLHRGAKVVTLLDSETRHRSLLLQVCGSRAERNQFLRAVSRAAVTITDGGRWHVAQGGSSKGLATRVLVNLLRGHHHAGGPIVAVGDGENDRSMLQAADLPFAIRRADGTVHPALRDLPRRLVPRRTGPAGWFDIVSTLGLAPETEVLHA